MYKIKKRQSIYEELEIEGNNGEKLNLTVNLTIDDILEQYNTLMRMLGEAQIEAQKDPMSEKAQTAVGAVVIALFKLIFGEDGCAKILDFYNERWSEMLEDIAPFISDCVQPKIKAAMKERARRFRRMR